MAEDKGCTFCSLPEDRIFYRNEYVKALFSLWPISDYHFLVIPARHTADEKDLTEREVVELFKARMKISAAIEDMTGMKNYNLLLNQGEVAGRTIPHLHYHTAFRKKGDLEKSPAAELLGEALTCDTVGRMKKKVRLAYEMLTSDVGGVRNVMPGMNDYKNFGDMIPSREKDVLIWTRRLKEYLEKDGHG